jgi:IS5 family transposase
VFANIRYLKRLDRFTLRSKVKVNIQWLLYCMVHNIGKIVNYGCIDYGFT